MFHYEEGWPYLWEGWPFKPVHPQHPGATSCRLEAIWPALTLSLCRLLSGRKQLSDSFLKVEDVECFQPVGVNWEMTSVKITTLLCCKMFKTCTVFMEFGKCERPVWFISTFPDVRIVFMISNLFWSRIWPRKEEIQSSFHVLKSSYIHLLRCRDFF